MPQLPDLTEHFEVDFGWAHICFSANAFLRSEIEKWSKELKGFRGIDILLVYTVTSKSRSVLSIGDTSGTGYRLPLIQHGGGNATIVFYGSISAADQFALVDELKERIQWMQAAQESLIAAHTFEHSPVIMYQAAEIEGRWVLTQANHALAQFLGVPVEDFIGGGARKQILDFVHPDDYSKLTSAYDFTRTTSQQMTLQYRLLSDSGEYVPVTERVHYSQNTTQKCCISVVWHRSLDQIDSSKQFSLFKDLESFTQDVSFDTGRDFMYHFCRRLEASKNINWLMLSANTHGDWWETWVISQQGILQPNFHYRMPEGADFTQAYWNEVSLADRNDDFFEMLFGRCEYQSVIPLVHDSEPVKALLFFGSAKPIADVDFIVHILRFFGVRILREISQARIADAQLEQNALLTRQKVQLTQMVTLLGYLDTVADEPEFLLTAQNYLQKAFELQSLDWVYWTSGEWNKVLQFEEPGVEWFHKATLLRDESWADYLERSRRSDRLVIHKAKQQVFWPVGQSEAGYLVMVLSFFSGLPDLELLQFSRNALALALQGLVQRENLRYQAMRDSLTGLGNRTQLHAWMKVALPTQTQSSLLLFDLNRFKEINDSFGHQFGDKLLKEIGPRISERLGRKEHYLARLGGDEFALFFPNTTPVEAREKADMLHSALAESYLVDRLRFQVEASVGVSHFPEHGADGHELLRCADVAMYASKSSGRNVVEFTAELDTTTPLRIAVLSELDEALEGGQLWVAFQPLMSTKTGQAGGCEALIRWTHPKFGPLSPGEFIPIAEMGEGIRKITDFVLFRTNRAGRRV